MMGPHVDFATAKRNIIRQGTKILHDIANAYDMGTLDDPKTSATFCGLLACICEGKVTGTFDEESGNIKWALTESYSKELEKLKKELLQSATATGKVVKGPW